MGFTFVIYIFLSNNPSSGDINSSNLPCSFWRVTNKGAGQTAWMCRMDCPFVICIQKVRFSCDNAYVFVCDSFFVCVPVI